jgi:hypothetical protein
MGGPVDKRLGSLLKAVPGGGPCISRSRPSRTGEFMSGGLQAVAALVTAAGVVGGGYLALEHPWGAAAGGVFAGSLVVVALVLAALASIIDLLRKIAGRL